MEGLSLGTQLVETTSGRIFTVESRGAIEDDYISRNGILHWCPYVYKTLAEGTADEREVLHCDIGDGKPYSLVR
jgi:hypothetical protein